MRTYNGSTTYMPKTVEMGILERREKGEGKRTGVVTRDGGA
jgi:hypothetical protein